MVDYCMQTMATSPSLAGGEKKYWWLRNRKIVDKYVKDAKLLIATQDQDEIASAVNLLNDALALSPKFEMALELKARSLLYLGRFKEVADMLQDDIPNLKMAVSDYSSSHSSSLSVSSDNSSTQLSRERAKLLSSENQPTTFKCFSVSELKKKVMSGLYKNFDKEVQWRYLILGQACCHLGLMEDAMVLLQTGRRLATAAFRRESVCWSDDSFSFTKFPLFGEVKSGNTGNQLTAPPKTESKSISQLISHIKLLVRRKTAALAALDAGLYSEAIRHFSKIVDGRRGAPQGFLAECFMHRASAFRSAGRIAEAIADCNRTLALEPSSIEALANRAALFETIRCLPDSLHDLEHLKLLYNSILRDRKLPGPAWKRQYLHYSEIPGKLCSLTTKIQDLKQRVASGETGNVDYYALIGLRRGCTRSELARAHLLLILRHKPDKAMTFIERCEFADERDLDSIRDRARMSALLLYRLIQKGYTNLMATVMDQEAAEKQRNNVTVALQAAQAIQAQQHVQEQPILEADSKPVSNRKKLDVSNCKPVENKDSTAATTTDADNKASSPFQGVFCRDLAIVGSLLSQAGFNRPLPVKYEALSC